MLRNKLVELYKPHQQECGDQKTGCARARDELSAIQLVDRQIDELKAKFSASSGVR